MILNYKCFEEIYKILYKYWTKLHNNKYIDDPHDYNLV